MPQFFSFFRYFVLGPTFGSLKEFGGVSYLHPNWVVLHVDIRNTFKLVTQSTFFKGYDFRSILLINFPHLFDDFMHTHPHYIFLKLPNMGIS